MQDMANLSNQNINNAYRHTDYTVAEQIMTV